MITVSQIQNSIRVREYKETKRGHKEKKKK